MYKRSNIEKRMSKTRPTNIQYPISPRLVDPDAIITFHQIEDVNGRYTRRSVPVKFSSIANKIKDGNITIRIDDESIFGVPGSANNPMYWGTFITFGGITVPRGYTVECYSGVIASTDMVESYTEIIGDDKLHNMFPNTPANNHLRCGTFIISLTPGWYMPYE